MSSGCATTASARSQSSRSGWRSGLSVAAVMALIPPRPCRHGRSLSSSGEEPTGELLDERTAFGRPAADEIAEAGPVELLDGARDAVEIGFDRQGPGAQDRRRVAPGRLRELRDARRLRRQVLGRTEAVPDVGVARGDRHHALLAVRADPD